MRCHCESWNHDADPHKVCTRELGEGSICADLVGNVCEVCVDTCGMSEYMILPAPTDEDNGFHAFTVSGETADVVAQKYPAQWALRYEQEYVRGLARSWALPLTFEQYDRIKAVMAEVWDDRATDELHLNMRKPRYVVAVWDCNREMGGPEEGGWSYEVGMLEAAVELHEEEAANIVREGLMVEFPYTGQRGMYSKRGPDYSVVILDRWDQYDLESHFDERLNVIGHYPLQHPRYE